MPETARPDEHEGHAFVASGSHAGRPKSWLAITVILAGFILGGVALCLGPLWGLFWAGVAVAALGGILALVFDVFSDVIVDSRRTMPAAEHHSPFERHPRS
ncbi:HGxxPAAW family protein [Thermopolyspora sp. NPDC052614]|uniref:HGxxPAAW family protein n=1 Tax=Thermopolyspora sp. NPDC052614 TaxID=3155682 RepID=UPI00342C42D8